MHYYLLKKTVPPPQMSKLTCGHVPDENEFEAYSFVN